MIVDGECDQLPEQAFLMCGGIEEVFEKQKYCRQRNILWQIKKFQLDIVTPAGQCTRAKCKVSLRPV